MKEAVRILKEKKVKITLQRVELLRVLREQSKHLSAEEIFIKVRKNFPVISLATVYSILEILKENGLVEELHIISDKSCFSVNNGIHHHFYCKKCKEIFDIDIPKCVTLSNKEINGNIIEDCQGYFYGICKNCISKQRKK